MNKSLSMSSLHNHCIKRGKIPLTNELTWACWSSRLSKTQNRAVCHWDLTEQRSVHLVERHLCALGSVTWHHTQRNGSWMAGIQTQGAGAVSRTSKVTGAGWLSAHRSGWPPSFPLSGRREMKTKGREEGVAGVCHCCLSHFISFFSLSLSYTHRYISTPIHSQYSIRTYFQGALLLLFYIQSPYWVYFGVPTHHI